MAEAGRRPVVRVVAWSAVADVVSIVVFVALGRKNHDEGGNIVTGTLKVAAPFLIALALGWLAARAWKSPTSLTTGVQIWVVTVVAGMLLRHFVFDRGTALPFIIVASGFTLLFLVGWRFVWEWWAARRA
jgi:chromate transport protein ChrA